MAFIGRTPTPSALTSSDISDGIISTAKIADNAVTESKTAWNDVPFRNLAINGDMSISQRSTSASSLTATGYHSIDRFVTLIDSMGTWTQSQSTTVPSGQGFAKSLKMDNTTADGSPSAGDRIFVYQKFEGQNLQHLKKGTSNAESLTASFWVRSNKTGTYICELNDNDNSRKISQSYTISDADTWEKKTLTFAGDTTGALDNDNANSFHISWWLGAGTTYSSGTLQTSWGSATNANRAVGQVNLADNTSNEWYITGVQLEVGTSASDFEFLPYDINLKRCERYYFKRQGDTSDQRAVSNGFATINSKYRGVIVFPTTMRSNPTFTESAIETLRPGAVNDAVSAGSVIDPSVNAAMVELLTDSGTPYTQGDGLTVRLTNSASAYIAFDAEL